MLIKDCHFQRYIEFVDFDQTPDNSVVLVARVYLNWLNDNLPSFKLLTLQPKGEFRHLFV